MILGTKARYAVMAMVELAARGGSKPVTLAELADSQEIPLPYLEQIFSRLRRGGLVKSVRGPGGGYVLTHSAAQTFIDSIISSVDEPIKMTRCATQSVEGCLASKARCATHDLWEGLGNQISDYLKGISLEDVCNRNLSFSACSTQKQAAY